MNFFEELKRRNVFRVGIAYGVAAWVLLQIADLVLENINAPEWVIQAMMLMVALGFIAALVIAWAYEMTPEGIKKEADVDRSQSVTGKTGQKLDKIVIGFLVVAVAVLLYRQSGDHPDDEPVSSKPDISETATPASVAAEPARKTIAVLPFRDMSAAGDQAYFGEGIAEELLNALVKFDGLKVASRTSSFSLASENLDIPAIAKRLDVAHILEGSIRTSGQQVRVTAQLIDVAEDVHLWSETYNGSLDDIFQIQDEITAKITVALKIQLAGAVASSAKQLTANPEAYQMYLQGRHLWRQRNSSALQQAVHLFTGAVELDPLFHQAWSNLAIAQLNLPDYDNSFDLEDQFLLGLESANRALNIEPRSTEALIIKANFEGWHCSQTESVRLYEQAIASNPQDPTAHHWYALNLATNGRLELAMEHIQKARSIDPLISAVISGEATFNRYMGYYKLAEEMYRRAAALGINDGSLFSVGMNFLYAGNLEQGRDLISNHVDKRDPRSIMRQRLFLEALDSDVKQAAFEEYVGVASESSYEIIRVLELLVVLGSTQTIAYQSTLECPHSAGAFWSDPFREQRKTKEFFALMERAGVVDYWREFGWPDDCASLNQELAECPQ